MAGNQNAIAYGILKQAGVDTEGMTPKEAWEKVKELGLTDSIEQTDLSSKIPTKESIAEKAKKVAQNVNITSDNYEAVDIVLDTVQSIMDECGLSKLETIETVDIQLGNSSINPAQATDRAITITNAFLKNPHKLYEQLNSWLEKRNREYKEEQHIFTRIANSDTKGKDKSSEKLIKLGEIVKYGRTNVLYEGSEVDCVVTHEMGHVFYKQTFFKFPEKIEKIKLAYEKAKERGDLYSLSLRASANEREFFSEALSLHRLNREPVPEYIRKLMKEVLS